MKTPADLSDKDALIAALLEQIEALMAENARLAARVAELEVRLSLPSRTPGSSSLPPPTGQKPSLSPAPKRRDKPHPGAHRLLHPEPTRYRDVRASCCRACEVYDWVEIPAVVPDVTRMSLHGRDSPPFIKQFLR